MLGERDQLRIVTRFEALLDQLVGNERSVANQTFQELAHFRDRWTAILIIVCDVSYSLQRHRLEYASRFDHAAADNNQLVDSIRMIDGELERRLAAHGIADKIRFFNTRRRHKRFEHISEECQSLIFNDRLIRFS